MSEGKDRRYLFQMDKLPAGFVDWHIDNMVSALNRGAKFSVLRVLCLKTRLNDDNSFYYTEEGPRASTEIADSLSKWFSDVEFNESMTAYNSDVAVSIDGPVTGFVGLVRNTLDSQYAVPAEIKEFDIKNPDRK